MFPASPNYSVVVAPFNALTDDQGNLWSINDTGQIVHTINPDKPNQQVTVDTSTANVDALALVDGTVWQQAHPPWAPDIAYWFAKSGNGWANGTTHSPLQGHATSDGTVVMTGNNFPPPNVPITNALIDNQGNLWWIANGQVVENGFADSRTNGVIELAFNQGTIWQEAVPTWGGGQDYWFAMRGGDWQPGTLVGPVPVQRTFVGGDDNSASNPAHWSPASLPKPGDQLYMNSGQTINVRGNALAGDNLYIERRDFGLPQDATINVSGVSRFTFGEDVGVGEVTVNLAADTQWIGGFGVSPFGNAVHITGAGTFTNTQTSVARPAVIDVPVVGNGTFSVNGSHGGPPHLEFVHSVSGGQSITIGGGSYGANYGVLQVDDPMEFQAKVQLGFGEMDLKGLVATSYDLKNDLLTLYNGNAPKYSLHLEVGPTSLGGLPPTNFGVSQVGGDIFVHANGGSYTDGGTLLPIKSV